MADSIVKECLREIEPLRADDLVGAAASRVITAELPALPAVEEDGRFAGIFGERELMTALFPGWVGEIGSSAMISRTLDDAIERRTSCALEPIRRYLNADPVLVDDEYSDTQLAQLFIRFRPPLVPIATRGHVHAVVTRGDFFRVLVMKLNESAFGATPGG